MNINVYKKLKGFIGRKADKTLETDILSLPYVSINIDVETLDWIGFIVFIATGYKYAHYLFSIKINDDDEMYVDDIVKLNLDKYNKGGVYSERN